MAAEFVLPQPSKSYNSVAPRSGVITLYGYGIQVRLDRGHLILHDGIGSDRRDFRLPRVGHGLKRLVVIGSDGMVSLAAVRWLADQDAAFVMLERDGTVLTTTGPVRPSDARLRRAQALAQLSGAALRIARELVRQKISGQANVARYKLLDNEAADTIDRLASDLPGTDTIPTIRLIEAQAASAYWLAWRTLRTNFPTKDLPRVPEHWRSFGTRISPLTGSPRLAVTPGCAMMNFLYALAESEARLALAALGLDPGLGVMHADQQGRDSLALDVLEPVRPQVDAYLLDWITTQPLKREWFFEQRNGNARLMASLAERLSQTALTWARVVGPVAEWVGQSFWRQTAKGSEHLLPTRLTQRRRSEGRGKELAPIAVPIVRRARLCELCGAEGVKNRYCRSCGVEVSRQNMTQAALVGHLKPRTAQAKARMSKALSDHAVAISWWLPASLPAWLNEECYVHKIQPRLKTIKIRQIAESLHVSMPYAALIRAGRRRPHSRHWQALAELVGVSDYYLPAATPWA